MGAYTFFLFHLIRRLMLFTVKEGRSFALEGILHHFLHYHHHKHHTLAIPIIFRFPPNNHKHRLLHSLSVISSSRVFEITPPERDGASELIENGEDLN